MFGDINIINPEAFTALLKALEEGKDHFVSLGSEDFEKPFSSIEPIEGYEKEVNLLTGKTFPYCCAYHENMFEDTQRWFKEFPNCCDLHRKLIYTNWFNKEKYQEVVFKILNQCAYTEYLISKRITNSDWFEDITDYLETNILSFGQLPKGFGTVGLERYTLYTKHYIQTSKLAGFSNEKKQKLIDYIEAYEKIEDNYIDLNILCSVYNEWFKIFPFELTSYFGHLKEFYANHLLVLKGNTKINRYNGLEKTELHTKSSLITFLVDLTDKILTEINGAVLYEKGLITDIQKTKLDLIVNERKLKAKQGYKSDNLHENKEYILMLQDWFKDEKRFIDELIPILITKKSSSTCSTKNYNNNSKVVPATNNPEEESLINKPNFCSFFNTISSYNFIMNLLVSEGYLQENTYIWKDCTKGNKGLLVAIIKYLHNQKFYRDNKKPSNEEIKTICRITFGQEISIDTIKKSQINQFNLEFIPPYSAI
ncbi:hypothetical protein [Emticicia sp. BO119]|uniref:hypothetical protein n=1 Tax=Emticicia sp. BO119 TaxID=2757768 RepID=UPI0015F097F0|nr:hypothetical protein [Emticicia sp. BO119]MBA4851520.1 hypothetical protein [Emticicia sp. BO119]